MKDGEPQFLTSARTPAASLSAGDRAPGAGGPGVVWLGGFKSDMDFDQGRRARRTLCEKSGRAFLRFDYSGHGLTGGDFELGTVSRWLEEARELDPQRE